jgi:hypothetical protein
MAKRPRITTYQQSAEVVTKTTINAQGGVKVEHVNSVPVTEKVSYFFGKRVVKKVYSSIKSKQ